jgi:hypothetical protein
MSVSSVINSLNEVMHRIRVKLYPNYLKGVEGAYIARVRDEAMLGIRDLVASLKNRAGFTGKAEDAIDYYEQIIAEAKYQLCDGFAVNFGPFSVHPHVGGTWDKVNEAHDRDKHPVSFRYRTRAEMRALTSQIEVEVDGLADVNGLIDEVVDVTTDAVNETLTPGGEFIITGDKLKITGDNAGVGLYFVSAADTTQRVKVTGRMAENAPTKLIGIIPVLTAGAWKVQVVTQYTGTSSTFLKAPRTIESKAEFTVA